MMIKALKRLTVGTLLAASLPAQAEIVPHIFTGVITEGLEAGETSGTYAGDLGTAVAMVMAVDFDTANATSVQQPDAGTTVYNFDGAPYWSVAFFYDTRSEYEAMESGFETNSFRLTHADDVDLTGKVLDGETLSGAYDVVELSFETAGGRGADIVTEHSVSLVGDSSWLQNGGPERVFDADYLFGHWQDRQSSTGEVVGFARLQISGFDIFAEEEGGAPNPVPVPASAWLFLSALLGVAGVARRRG